MRGSTLLAALLVCSCMPDYAALKGKASNSAPDARLGADALAINDAQPANDLHVVDVPIGGTGEDSGATGRGGATGGTSGTGGAISSGGTTGLGSADAAPDTSGTAGSGGAVGAGGLPSIGGTLGSGGTPATGGTTNTGGLAGTGGISASGGMIGTGGMSASGGIAVTGGMTATGGSTSSGGKTGSGGLMTTGGTAAAGGASGAGGSTCAVVTAGPFQPRAASSAGFQGTSTAYGTVEQRPCAANADCTAPCLAAGGTSDFCTTGTRCSTQCDLPGYWYQDFGATILPVKVNLIYSAYHDLLLLSDFGVQVPPDATITGIQVDLSRYGAVSGVPLTDYTVRLMQNGQGVGLDHKKIGNWPANGPVSASYGDAIDLWGVAWTPTTVTSSQFGLSIAADYGMISGTTWAYVTDARLSVFYLPAHCP